MNEARNEIGKKTMQMERYHSAPLRGTCLRLPHSSLPLHLFLCDMSMFSLLVRSLKGRRRMILWSTQTQGVHSGQKKRPQWHHCAFKFMVCSLKSSRKVRIMATKYVLEELDTVSKSEEWRVLVAHQSVFDLKLDPQNFIADSH